MDKDGLNSETYVRRFQAHSTASPPKLTEMSPKILQTNILGSTQTDNDLHFLI